MRDCLLARSGLKPLPELPKLEYEPVGRAINMPTRAALAGRNSSKELSQLSEYRVVNVPALVNFLLTFEMDDSILEQSASMPECSPHGHSLRGQSKFVKIW
jgi:hypothetical protein